MTKYKSKTYLILNRFLEHKKYQQERLKNKRREQREQMSLATPTKSYSEEEVISYFEMMNDPNTLIEGITNLTLLCSEAIFSVKNNPR